MSWSNFSIPATVSEIAIEERLQQQENGDGTISVPNETDDSADTLRVLQDSKLEPLMISVWFAI